MACAGTMEPLKGGAAAVREFTANEAIAVGDVVKIDAATGYLEKCAADGTQMLGWALSEATASGDEIEVLLAFADQGFWMKIAGTTWAATMLLHNYALAGSTGAFTCDIGDAGHDLFKPWAYDTTYATALVTVIPTCSEAMSVEPI